jgi:DNA-binding HxlR family transcriptional regulator/putative sterol carrier protein
MVGRRKYDDTCAVAHGLDLIGERWGLLVVRELLLGPKRFTDLRAGLPGASPDVLAQRLRELQQAGVVMRRKLAPPANAWVYELTAWGAQLEPIVTGLARWAASSPSMPHEGPIGVDSVILSLKALFDPQAAARFDATIALRLAEHDFRVRIGDGSIDITRGPAERPDALLDTDPGTLSRLLRPDRQVAAAMRAGSLRVDGDLTTAERFLDLFPLPLAAGVDTG